MAASVSWVAAYAAEEGLRYEPDVDERWVRVWEPFATLKTPVRYEHALEATGTTGSLTIARMVVEAANHGERGGVGQASAWIAIAQDVRMQALAAATCDLAQVFGEPLDLVTMPRVTTGDAAFDRVFATFAPTAGDLRAAITPSLRKLTLSWGIPLHFEIRKGGFILAPVALPAARASLTWLVRAVQFFGEKASKGANLT